jgi:hypothetical protein
MKDEVGRRRKRGRTIENRRLGMTRGTREIKEGRGRTESQGSTTKDKAGWSIGRVRTWEDVGGRGVTLEDVGGRGRTSEDEGGRGKTWEDLG